ncbi:hypothetical protein WA158_006591 [Blastocystis sp. Blastoise]
MESDDPELKEVQLNGYQLNDTDISQFCNSFKNTTHVKSIDLSRNNITEKGCNFICQTLKDNKSVKSLILAKNSIGTNGAMHIAQLLSQGSGLTLLNLNSTSIDSEGIDEICSSICHSTDIRLKDLYIDSNNIGDNGFDIIINLLNEYHKLENLYIRSNNFTDEAATKLLYFFNNSESIRSLRFLDMSDNAVSVTLSTAIKSAVNQYESFTFLCVNNNLIASTDEEIEEEGPKPVIDAIPIDGDVRCRTRSIDLDITDESIPRGYKTVSQKIIMILSQLYAQSNSNANDVKTSNIPADILEVDTHLSPTESKDKQEDMMELDIYDRFGTIAEDNSIDFDQLNTISIRMSPQQLSTCLKLCSTYIKDQLSQKNNSEYDEVQSILSVYLDNINVLMMNLSLPPVLPSNENSFPLSSQLPLARGGSVERVGILRAGIITFLSTLLTLKQERVMTCVIENHVNDIVFDMFFRYAHNDTLHLIVYNYFEAVIESQNEGLVRDLFERYNLIGKLIDMGIQARDDKNADGSVKYNQFGFIFNMIQYIKKAIDTEPHGIIAGIVDSLKEKWTEFLSNYIDPHATIEEKSLGGSPPKNLSIFDFGIESYASMAFQSSGSVDDDEDDEYDTSNDSNSMYYGIH